MARFNRLRRGAKVALAGFLQTLAGQRRCAWCAAAAVLAVDCVVRGAGAQGLVVPSSQFGALSFPVTERGQEAGISIDRFTQFSGDPPGIRIRHYALQQTLGLQSFYVGYAARTSEGGAVGRVTVQLTPTSNQPTEFFQNQVLHGLVHSPRVPVGYAPSELNGELAVEVDQWFGPMVSGSAPAIARPKPFFLGGGAAVGTIDKELYAQAGVRIEHWRPWGLDLPSPSIMVRAAVVRGAHAFPTRAIEPGYVSAAGSLRLPVDHWTGSSAVPAIEVGFTTTTGFFRGANGGKIPEKLCTVAFEWGRGAVAIETWNDACGNKDQGPTFGLGVRFRTVNSE